MSKHRAQSSLPRVTEVRAPVPSSALWSHVSVSVSRPTANNHPTQHHMAVRTLRRHCPRKPDCYQFPVRVGQGETYKCGRPYHKRQLMTTISLCHWVLPKEQHQERAMMSRKRSGAGYTALELPRDRQLIPYNYVGPRTQTTHPYIEAAPERLYRSWSSAQPLGRPTGGEGVTPRASSPPGRHSQGSSSHCHWGRPNIARRADRSRASAAP